MANDDGHVAISSENVLLCMKDDCDFHESDIRHPHQAAQSHVEDNGDDHRVKMTVVAEYYMTEGEL